MKVKEDLTQEEYSRILDGKFVRIDEDEEGYAVRVFNVDGKEYAVY